MPPASVANPPRGAVVASGLACLHHVPPPGRAAFNRPRPSQRLQATSSICRQAAAWPRKITPGPAGGAGWRRRFIYLLPPPRLRRVYGPWNSHERPWGASPSDSEEKSRATQYTHSLQAPGRWLLLRRELQYHKMRAEEVAEAGGHKGAPARTQPIRLAPRIEQKEPRDLSITLRRVAVAGWRRLSIRPDHYFGVASPVSISFRHLFSRLICAAGLFLTIRGPVISAL
jgi:hypothetical protein